MASNAALKIALWRVATLAQVVSLLLQSDIGPSHGRLGHGEHGDKQ